MSNPKIKELTDNFTKMKREFQKEVSKVFVKAAEEIFLKYPLLESIGWKQYTPYFCDGDPCTFSVYSDSPLINGEDEYGWNWIKTGNKTKWGGEEEKLSQEDEWKNNCSNEVAELLDQIDYDLLQSTYGEGLVTLTRDGKFNTEDIDHD